MIHLADICAGYWCVCARVGVHCVQATVILCTAVYKAFLWRYTATTLQQSCVQEVYMMLQKYVFFTSFAEGEN